MAKKKKVKRVKRRIYDKTLSELVDHYLIQALRVVAKSVCHDLGVKFKSFGALDDYDELCSDIKEIRHVVGFNYDGDIRIRLKPYGTNRYFPISYLIDTVVHEVVHEIHPRHTKAFWATYRQALNKVKRELQLSLKTQTLEEFTRM